MKIHAWLLSLMLAAPAASASVDRGVLQFEAIRTQQAEIRTGVESRSGLFKDLPSNTRSELLAKQTQLLQMMEGKQSTNELNETQKTEVFNTLEWIEAAVNNAADERMVCERRPVLGSTRKERVCKTAGQLRVEREAARDQMDSRSMQQ